MRPLLPRILRRLFPGGKDAFIFERQPVILPDKPESLNLYIHLPFCRQLCPFCPYMKEVYDPTLSAAYEEALLQELEGYRTLWGEVNVESVFFGGGTPSMTPGTIERTLDWIAANFRLGSEVGVEVNPVDASPAVIETLKNSGVSLASLGVQSFNDRLLGVLGRDYDSELALEASRRLLGAGFDTVDIDLMFAIPTQSLEEMKADIETALKLGAGQISTYPLLYFSYAPLRKRLRQNKVATPSWRQERQMLETIARKAREAGYQRTSIWSFNRPETVRYTTVTRDSFIGIGVSATSKIGDYFKVNTFSVAEYIKAVKEGSPTALATRLNTGDKMAYWFFWRTYDLAIDTDAFRHLFGQELPRPVRALLSLMELLGLAQRQGSILRLSEMGAYLAHLIEKEYTHAYLETLWNTCFKEPWPRRVVL
jgi:coproporphyrinogen III oxidase-like Fe-S oxidoreductase